MSLYSQFNGINAWDNVANLLPGEKITHYKYSVKELGVDNHGKCKCSAHDITFGGRCLNCGYDPNIVK